MPPISRRSFLSRFRRLGALSLVSAGGAYGYGAALERHRLAVERHELKLDLGARGPRRLRVAAFSDLHFDPLYETDYVAKCVAQANALSPDLVVLPGDFITRTNVRIADLAELLGGLTARHGVFASLGNHDFWHQASVVRSALEARGVEVLMDQHTRIACGGGELILAGLQSVWAGSPDWTKASRGIRADERALLVIHEPDFITRLKGEKRIALQISGHTHGGQVRLPGFGALRLPQWGVKYQAGLYDVDGVKLHVGRGVGTITFHVRLFCPPEITCFDITNTGAPA
jgi:predicted MPP superfamily phosphohydrolase